jgi:uncharacterized protein YfaS (alpha-2-macroglobulin family)
MRKLVCLLFLALCLPLAAADMTRLTVHVTNTENKPVGNASVVVKFIKGRSKVNLKKIQKSWELRTSQEGTVSIPQLPQGEVLIQVIAKNYQTFGEKFDVAENEKTLEIKLNPPQEQYSAH